MNDNQPFPDPAKVRRNAFRMARYSKRAARKLHRLADEVEGGAKVRG